MKKNFFRLAILLLFLPYPVKAQESNVLVLFRGTSPDAKQVTTCIIPWLEHLGLPFRTIDADREKPTVSSSTALVILGHSNIFKRQKHWKKFEKELMLNGTGLMAFESPVHGNRGDSAAEVRFVQQHYITQQHTVPGTFAFMGKMKLPRKNSRQGEVLLEAGGVPVLQIDEKGASRRVWWSTADWMSTYVSGPLGGMDDLFWRSIVWAARKPFVMHCLPPLVTMRVDDVAGRGEIWHQTPLYWVGVSAKYGFKPWLGLFIYNLTPAAVNELRSYLLSGDATAAPHAFGRPNRSNQRADGYLKTGNADDYPFWYDTTAFRLRATWYDEFIYFDHHRGKPWSEEEAIAGLEAADQWWKKNQPLPMSKYLIAHFYEMAENNFPFISERWGIEYLALGHPVNLPYADSVPWLVCGPFRKHEPPGTCTSNPALRGNRPVYYADFVTINGCKLFNCFTEILDDAGYEWAPDNNVEATVERAVRQLRRALDAKAPAVLFTHETDYIYRIRPENWEMIMAGIRKAINPWNVIPLTSDSALRIVRAYSTSSLDSYSFSAENLTLTLNVKGYADVATTAEVFTETEKGIASQLVMIRPHDGPLQIPVVLKGSRVFPEQNERLPLKK